MFLLAQRIGNNKQSAPQRYRYVYRAQQMKRAVLPFQEGVAVAYHHLNTTIVPVHPSNGGCSQKYDKANANAQHPNSCRDASFAQICNSLDCEPMSFS